MFVYDLIITPIKQILEAFFLLFVEMTYSAGFSIIGLSLVVTLACLPLYVVAEGWQETERKIQQDMAPGIKRIKAAFKGDEQYMMLSTFYKQHRYHPIMALRSSFGLLIQIPFFIAAYSFLSHLSRLSGLPFFFIKDLGAPDALLSTGGFSINVLPVAMTLINCVSGALYSRGHGLREKIQIYVSAAVFLVLLYDSPSALVLYWTMNNVLSLVKNIFYKMKHPVRALYRIAAVFCVLAAVFALIAPIHLELRAMLLLFCAAVWTSPLWIRALDRVLATRFTALDRDTGCRALIFVLSALILAVLTGLHVPSTLIQSEPEEFCFVDSYLSPFVFLRAPFFQALGLFVFWPGCFYALFGGKIKKLLTLAAAFTAAYALVNVFAFSGAYGPLTQQIRFMEPQNFAPSRAKIVLNALLAAGILAVALTVLAKRPRWLVPYSAIVLLSMCVTSTRNIAQISAAYRRMTPPVVKDSVEPVFHLSKTGRNVLVFMQDRLFMPFVDTVFDEDPSLAAHWDGFVFYPNTVSMGHLTMLGTPGLFGGYDYALFEMNRPGKTLREKHNEAILSQPIAFAEAGFDVTVSDMPYENYLKQPVEKMYAPYPYIHRTQAIGVYSDYWYKKNGMKKQPMTSNAIKRNFIYFGLFKAVPPVLRRLVYHKNYWNISDAKTSFNRFMDNYSVLDLLPELVDTTAGTDTFFLIDNEATHEQNFLQAPDYRPADEVTNYGDTDWRFEPQYHAQAGVTRLYAKFFDYLKEQGVYDNTRIIIVSDHGALIDTKMFENDLSQIPFYKERMTAALLVKDFDAHTPDDVLQTGRLAHDMTFMTNADTAALATDGIIPGAKNPFTGNPFRVEDKAARVKMAHPLSQSTRIRDQDHFAIGVNEWYTVHDDIFTKENWSHLPPQDYGK